MVSAYDPDEFDRADGQPRRPGHWLDDYDDIKPGDTITVDLELLDRLATAIEQYDRHVTDHDYTGNGLHTAFVIDAARTLLADTAGNEVEP